MKVRLTLLTMLCLLLTRGRADAQSFYVEKNDGLEQPVINELLEHKYQVVFKEEAADYIIKCMIGNTGMGRAKASAMLVDAKTGALIGKTKEANGQTAMWNGYRNPKMGAIKKVAEKYLIDMVRTHTTTKPNTKTE